MIIEDVVTKLEYSVAKQKIGLKKLARLAKFLRSLKRSQFDYSSYADFDEYKLTPDQCTAKHPCCSTACALGWATVLFRNLRLRGNFVVNLETENEDNRAASETFYITEEEAEYLFVPSYSTEKNEENATPKYVAKKIEKFIKKKQKELSQV